MDVGHGPAPLDPSHRGRGARLCAQPLEDRERDLYNTLKNHGYELEHSSGHGHQHLATVLMLLMLLAFLLDPSCRSCAARCSKPH